MGKFVKKTTVSAVAGLLCSLLSLSAQEMRSLDRAEAFLSDSLGTALLDKVENMPNIEVGNGVTIRPKNELCELTFRFRMQNLVGQYFGQDFAADRTEAMVRRLRLRLDGYVFSPQVVYSIQLGLTGKDAKPTANGMTNIIMDAIVYYKPSSAWSIGLGQSKIKTNRSFINSSGALQFVDRSIVSSQFTADRDFGLFGEYHHGGHEGFALSTYASVTLGEGRNWGTSQAGGLAYNARLELFPCGKFHEKGQYTEGDTYREDKVKLMLAGGYSFNHKALLDQACKGSMLPAPHDIGTYYADLMLKYRGFAFNADFMGRHACDNEAGDVFTGCGVNAQTSYMLTKRWELALRNSVLLPDAQTRRLEGYDLWNQSTLGVSYYIIGHSLKLQFDLSYNYMKNALSPSYDRLGLRFQLELGL